MMQAEPDILALAKQHLADYDAHHPGLLFARGASFLSVRQAYALQLEVAQLRRARGELLAGFKVGCVSEAIRRQFGLDRAVFGHVWASEIHPDGVVLDSSHFEGLAIEGEFAFRVAEDIPSAEAVRDDPVRFLASTEVVIELHNYVFRAQPPTAQELVANNALHAGVVLSAVPPSELGPDFLLDQEISIFRNGELQGAKPFAGCPPDAIESHKPVLSAAEGMEDQGLKSVAEHPRCQALVLKEPSCYYRESGGA